MDLCVQSHLLHRAVYGIKPQITQLFFLFVSLSFLHSYKREKKSLHKNERRDDDVLFLGPDDDPAALY